MTRLKTAHAGGKLPAELARLRQIRLIIVDEDGYIPFEQDAANLLFQLVSSRYEHASLILTSNPPFGRWGDVFDDQAVAAAMIDRIVHHGRGFNIERRELPAQKHRDRHGATRESRQRGTMNTSA